MNYSTLVETKLVEIHQEQEKKELNWDMDYSIGWWSANWDNKITVNLKGKNDNFNKWNGQNNRWPINLRIFEVQLPYVLRKRIGGLSNQVSADYLLINTLKNIKEKKETKENVLDKLKKQVEVKYIGDFNYANSINCSNNNGSCCCSDLNSVDSSCARKYDYFDGNGYGYSLYNSFGLKTISETSREVQFEIKLPIVENENAHNLSEIGISSSSDNKISGDNFYFTGGYIIAWNKDDDKFLKNAKCENCCSKTIKDSTECKCVDGWKEQMEDAMKEKLFDQCTFNNKSDGTGKKISDYFIKYNDGKNDPINNWSK